MKPPEPCVYCGGSDFTAPRGAFRQPCAVYERVEPGTEVGPFHPDCILLYAEARRGAFVNRRGRGTPEADGELRISGKDHKATLVAKAREKTRRRKPQ